MANVRKRILQLTALESASLDTTIVGVDNGTTYRIELDVLADAVTSRVNILDRDRLNSLESSTGSYLTSLNGAISSSSQLTSSYDTRYIVSGSITQTTWDNIANKPDGIVSQSTDLSALNSFTQSQVILNTAFNSGISARLQTSSFNDFSASVDSRIIAATNEQSFNGLISGSSQLTSSFDERYVLSGSITQTTWDNISGKPNGLVSQSTDLTSLNSFTSSYYTDSASFSSRIDAATNEQSLSHLVTTSSFNSYTASISTASLVDRLNIIENTTSSYETKGSGILSGSISYTSLTNIPSGIISQSVDLTSLNQFTASISTESLVNRLNVIESVSSSWITENETGSFLTSLNGAISSSSQLTASYDTRYTLSGSVQPLPNGLISGSSQLTASYDARYALSSSVSSISSSFNGRFNGLVTTGSNTFSGSQIFSGSMVVTSGQVIASTITNNSSSLYLQSGSNLYVQNNGIVEITGSIILNGTTYTSLTGSGTIPSGTVSGSSQLTSSYDLRYTLSGSVQPLPSGVISGSSQLTSSFDTRYALSGSGGGTIPAGTISGSSQLTSSFDGRYVQTGSFNTLTASFNSFTASAQSVTTGSNSFNGTQTITGSLIITTGSFVGSQILANTSSLYLTSGSNMYVQNNGVVEITGSLNVRGTTRFETVGGDEGGEIEFGIPQTNTSLSTRVVQDIFQNRLRIFDGNTNGVFIDLSKAPIGVAGEITWKSSGIVNAGTFVQLDNIKATVPSSGNRALALATVSGTISGYISGHYQGISSSSSGITQTVSLSTSTSTSIFGWNFGQQGDTSHYILRDDTNNRVYRFVVIIGGSYNNNFISIERLH